jgi:hypothetical protein
LRFEELSRLRSKFEVAIKFARFEGWVEDDVDGGLITNRTDKEMIGQYSLSLR